MAKLVDALESFAGRAVFVTGCTGFKGAWLCQWLAELGAEVTGYALSPQERSLYAALALGEQIRFVEGDVRDLEHMQRALESSRADTVFHLAAQALVRRLYREPHLTFTTNIVGGLNVLEAVRNAASVRALVYVATDKCYRNREWPWGYREIDELGGHDPYSASKAAAELVLEGYQQSFFAGRADLGCASARGGNVIGGGDFGEDRLVPDIMRALQSGAPVRIRNPAHSRPWQHVLELLSGYLTLASALHRDPSLRGAWNFGPSEETVRTVLELCTAMLERYGTGELVTEVDTVAPRETALLRLVSDKARQQLGWQPQLTFEQGVELTADFYRRLAAGEPARSLVREQIAAYVGR